jgi:DNA topoisomerase I
VPQTARDPIDGPDAARAAGLRYVSDAANGIARRRAGTGFHYVAPDGSAVRDAETLARIRRLAIPPAWQDVWICSRDDGHLQATGRDARGRKQYRYHPRWREVRDETKYARMIAFGRALPRVRRRVARDLRRPGLPRAKVLAAIVRLLETTFIRIGNEEYARANESFGLTTLRGRQVRVRGARLDFSFRGKSGVRHEVVLTDRRLAAIVRHVQDLPGEELFQYVDEAGETRAIGSADVNDYLREITGEGFTSKDFRTWAGTLLCAQALARLEAPASQAVARREIVQAVAGAAKALRNTPAVCRKCYVHPVVLESYAAGRLRAEMRGASNEGALIALLREAERAEASGRRSRRKRPFARPGSWRRGPRPSSGAPGSRAPLFAPQP